MRTARMLSISTKVIKIIREDNNTKKKNNRIDMIENWNKDEICECSSRDI